MTGTIQCVVLDCPDVQRLAEFYRSLLGGEVNRPDRRWALNDDWSTLHTPSGFVLCFQRVPEHRAPLWGDPTRPQQLHLDIAVPDLTEAEQIALDSGAVLLDGTQPWRVYADPAGHPFCLLQE
ncbi:VOC family protein [Spongiactinospora sp. TRM90649]|uniref:VOC family protein n=1 Tax=Spongiactinospora sp. TRM90649 TaxID=3031114 RepID=UPI0023F626B4|nr:VOC family protein [Spongiactinospora sp. TRM90649]MDF5756472.1 VOC family protein [Spongiactinospora sp. TRM90649]